ncbi:Hypothetical predicted protein [Olea europaea subsp. europaea]|uniref:Uncharacterized protein n=1 Tax=Olea europaea subsp. europaea TaxID=158383 RepID=A0A8S0S0U6_OLEEU|nr:Hypothetical predicted protein [Olea europaea subsp. europaea]
MLDVNKHAIAVAALAEAAFTATKAVAKVVKLTSGRVKKASTNQNDEEEQSFQFMPTPMLGTEKQSGCIQTTTTMHSQSVASHVPTDEVKFDELDDIIDVESTTLRTARTSMQQRTKAVKLNNISACKDK